MPNLFRAPGFSGGSNLFGDIWSNHSSAQDSSMPRPQPIYRRPLPPAEAKSFGRSLTEGGLSGLGYVASVLDKPGRAVRGVLGGHPDELGAIVPFSDSAGLTNPERAVSGRDLTDKIGLTRKGDKGWGAWTGGLAAELATDPLTYTSFGAKNTLTAAGHVARDAGALKGVSRRGMLEGFHALEPELRAAGHTTEGITHMVDQGKRIAGQSVVDAAAKAKVPLKAGQPLSGLAGIGLPFRRPSFVMGTGPTAQKVAGAIDKAADFARYKVPGARTLSALFDPDVAGAVDEITQRGRRAHGAPQLDAARAAGRADYHNLLTKIDPIIKAGAHPERDILAATRATAEGVPTRLMDPALVAQVAPIGADVAGISPRQLAETRKLGLPLQDLADPFIRNHVPRRALESHPSALQLKGDQFPVVSSGNIHREKVLRDVPGGTAALDRYAMDPRLSGPNRTLPDAAVVQALKNDMVDDLIATPGGFPAGPAGIAMHVQLDAKATELAERLKSLGERHAADQLPLYTPRLASNIAGQAEAHAQTTAAGATIHGIIGDAARPFQAGMVPVSVLLKKLGLKTWKGDQAAGTPIEGALVESYRKLARQGAGPVEPLLTGKRKALARAADQYGVTEEQASQILRQYGKWSRPEEMVAPIKGIDSITNTFKNMAYSIWLPSHVRNALSAFTSNLRDSTPLSAYGKQLGVMTGRGGSDLSKVPGLPAGLSRAQQAEWIRGRQFASGKVFSGHNAANDLAGDTVAALTTTPGRLTPHPPGSNITGPTGNVLGDTANLIKEGLIGGKDSSPLDILGQSGVRGKKVDTWSPLVAGRRVGQNVEDFFRGANWIGNVERGMTPAMAGERLNKLHFDYDRMTQFEKRVMRRLVPFYTFQRKNLPLQIEQMIANPAQVQAQLRPMNQGKDQDSYTPRYLASGVALPVGAENKGTQRYVSSLGLPIEEAFERLKFQNGMPDIKGTALAYAAGLNPLVKAPLEQLFDTQFHTGRKLSDLRPTKVGSLGGILSDESAQLGSQILANSPATRFVSSLEKLIDSRKGIIPKALNLATGVKVTDVDVEKSRAIETRKALESLLSKSPHLASPLSFYVPPDQAKSLSPAEVERMRMYSDLQAKAQAYVERRRRSYAHP